MTAGAAGGGMTGAGAAAAGIETSTCGTGCPIAAEAGVGEGAAAATGATTAIVVVVVGLRRSDMRGLRFSADGEVINDVDRGEAAPGVVTAPYPGPPPSLMMVGRG
jgi:hypothetical protein